MTWEIHHGLVEELVVKMPGHFDAVLCDPPYGIKFMGAAWDHGVPSAATWSAVREVLRPGSHVLAFGGTRTWHRLATALEDSGLEMRDTLMWLYGGGWPKPADVSKSVDKELGAFRPAVGHAYAGTVTGDRALGRRAGGSYALTAPGSPEAAIWAGYHANLKPAWEPALLFRNPGPPLARCALDHGVAGLNVDGCRIATYGRPCRESGERTVGHETFASTQKRMVGRAAGTTTQGRWPANVLLTCDCEREHGPGCPVFELDGQSGMLSSGNLEPHHVIAADNRNVYSHSNRGVPSQVFGGDSGGASRFFYTGKVRPSERGDSAHPCMKPLALCRYLATLLLPPDTGRPRRLLVPFSGSGSEALAALQAGWDEVVGIEADPKWVDLSRARIERELLAWKEDQGKVTAAEAAEAGRPVQLGLL